MDPWKRDFAVLGQEMIEHLETHPHKGPAAVARLRKQLTQIKRGSRDNDSEGIFTSQERKDEKMATQMTSLKTPGGDDVKIPTRELLAALEEQGVHVRRKRRDEDEEEEEEDDEEEVHLSRSMKRTIARNVAIEAKTNYAWELQSTRIAYSWMEFAGKLVLAIAALGLAGWVLSKVMVNPTDAELPEGVRRPGH